jgi:hypothetical protein
MNDKWDGWPIGVEAPEWDLRFMHEPPAPDQRIPWPTPPPAAVEAMACPVCESRLLQLADAEPHPPGGWNVVLECPECWTTGELRLDDGGMEAFDEHFDDGIRAMIDELRRLSTESMLEDVQRFVGALQADAILPEDF